MTSVIKDVFIKKTNSIKRDRYCKCGFLFSTFEKFIKSSKIRKQRPSTQWKNDRVLWYGIARYNSVLKAHKKGFQKLGLRRKVVFKNKNSIYHSIEKFGPNKTYKSEKEFYAERQSYFKNKLKNQKEPVIVFNEKGKSFVLINIKGYKTTRIDVESKKQTISNILLNPDYWWLRNYYFPKKDPSEKDNKDKFRKEAQEFYKSVCSYVKDTKYNQEFFINNNPETEIWKDPDVWGIYSLVR